MTRIKKRAFYSLFLLTGIASMFMFNRGDEFLFPYGIFPGLLFVLTCMLCGSAMTSISAGRMLKFFFSAGMVYIILFLITLYSSYIAFAVGIFTGALGALAVFSLYNRFIHPIQYRRFEVAALGATAFIVNDIIVFTQIRELAPAFFRKDMTGNFSAVYLVWQSVIGFKLTRVIAACRLDIEKT
ncbi:MAG: hypothetical protein JST26_08925 [Bacteroidetes bacterium]|nr:hypothetical protein [Bacteroidota bacterium]